MKDLFEVWTVSKKQRTKENNRLVGVREGIPMQGYLFTYCDLNGLLRSKGKADIVKKISNTSFYIETATDSYLLLSKDN